MVYPFGSGTLPSGGADPQDYYYLNYVMPGSYARQMYETRLCSPLWNVFGCKTNPDVVGQTTEADETSAVSGEPETGDNKPLVAATIGGLVVGIGIVYALSVRGKI